MSDPTIYFNDEFAWVVSRETLFVAIQPAPLAILPAGGEAYEGFQTVLQELGRRRHRLADM